MQSKKPNTCNSNGQDPKYVNTMVILHPKNNLRKIIYTFLYIFVCIFQNAESLFLFLRVCNFYINNRISHSWQCGCYISSSGGTKFVFTWYFIIYFLHGFMVTQQLQEILISRNFQNSGSLGIRILCPLLLVNGGSLVIASSDIFRWLILGCNYNVYRQQQTSTTSDLVP